jgi:hypothetical protein
MGSRVFLLPVVLKLEGIFQTVADTEKSTLGKVAVLLGS